jgi:hypothetical protein
MRFEIHHFHHLDKGTTERLGRIEHLLGVSHDRQETIMATLDDLKAAVQRETDVETSVVSLLNGISQQLKDAQAANDPAAIQAVIDQIDANTKTMSDAVTANTPAA